MLACAILFDEYDFNTGNFGIIEKDGEKRWVGIDFGKSHFVRVKKDIDSLYIRRTLNFLLVEMKRIVVRGENFNVIREESSDDIEENTFLMSNGKFIPKRDENLTLSKFYAQKAFERFEKIKQHTRELRIQMILDITPEKYNFEKYKLGECIMEFPQEDGIINECVEFISQDPENLIKEVKETRHLIKDRQPSDYGLPKYISEGNAEVLKEYLQYIGKYFEFTSKVLDKFGESSDEDKFRCEGLVVKKLKKIEKMLKRSTENQGAPSVSGDTKNKKLRYEQPQKPRAVAAPIPTVVGAPQDPKPETKPIIVASVPTFCPITTTRKADNQPITENVEQLRPEVPSHEPVAPSGDHDQNQNYIKKEEKEVRFADDTKPQQNPQTGPQKPKNSSNYCYIVGFAIAGLVIGLAAAYFAGAATLTPVLAAVSVFIGACCGWYVCWCFA